MILYIDTTNGEVITLALLCEGGMVTQQQIAAKYQQSEKLLVSIEAMLKKETTTMSDLAGIIVANGPGQFTATRIGIATANALGYGLNIPVAGVRSDEIKDLNDLAARSAEVLQSVERGNIVEPFYDKEPNITMPKKVKNLEN